MLSSHDNEQSDLLHRIFRDSRNAQQCPLEFSLLKLFTVPELMRWPLVAQQYGPTLCQSPIFSSTPASNANISNSLDSDNAAFDNDKPYKRWLTLRRRVIEHNVRVVAKYYTRIDITRLTQLLDLDEEETEKYISQLVTAKTIYAKIDRPARIVSFEKKRDADAVLNEWSASMKSLLGLLERVDHLITKEEMMARLKPEGDKKKAEKAN